MRKYILWFYVFIITVITGAVLLIGCGGTEGGGGGGRNNNTETYLGATNSESVCRTWWDDWYDCNSGYIRNGACYGRGC